MFGVCTLHFALCVRVGRDASEVAQPYLGPCPRRVHIYYYFWLSSFHFLSLFLFLFFGGWGVGAGRRERKKAFQMKKFEKARQMLLGKHYHM